MNQGRIKDEPKNAETSPFLKRLTPFVKKLTHFLQSLTYLFKEKITSKGEFSCSIQNNSLPLQRIFEHKELWQRKVTSS